LFIEEPAFTKMMMLFCTGVYHIKFVL